MRGDFRFRFNFRRGRFSRRQFLFQRFDVGGLRRDETRFGRFGAGNKDVVFVLVPERALRGGTPFADIGAERRFDGRGLLVRRRFRFRRFLLRFRLDLFFRRLFFFFFFFFFVVVVEFRRNFDRFGRFRRFRRLLLRARIELGFHRYRNVVFLRNGLFRVAALIVLPVFVVVKQTEFDGRRRIVGRGRFALFLFFPLLLDVLQVIPRALDFLNVDRPERFGAFFRRLRRFELAVGQFERPVGRQPERPVADLRYDAGHARAEIGDFVFRVFGKGGGYARSLELAVDKAARFGVGERVEIGAAYDPLLERIELREIEPIFKRGSAKERDGQFFRRAGRLIDERSNFVEDRRREIVRVVDEEHAPALRTPLEIVERHEPHFRFVASAELLTQAEHELLQERFDVELARRGNDGRLVLPVELGRKRSGEQRFAHARLAYDERHAFSAAQASRDRAARLFDRGRGKIDARVRRR